MTTRLVLLGGGAFGREILDVIDAHLVSAGGDKPRFEVLGVLDRGIPDPEYTLSYGVPHLGSDDELTELPPDVEYTIGIGSPTVRREVDTNARNLGRHSPVIVHPNAWIGRRVSLGPGVVVCSHASLTNHIDVGRHSHLNLNVTIGHDTTVGDYVTISPQVAISGRVTIEDGAYLGTGASVIEGITIGAGAVIGAGAAVIRDVPANTTVVGVPAKPLRGLDR